MLVANLVVDTLPGKAQAVAERMGQIKGMGLLSTEGDRVTGSWKVPDGRTREGIYDVLRAMNPEIVEVYPTMLLSDDEE
jgi:hypothetical protein